MDETLLLLFMHQLFRLKLENRKFAFAVKKIQIQKRGVSPQTNERRFTCPVLGSQFLNLTVFRRNLSLSLFPLHPFLPGTSQYPTFPWFLNFYLSHCLSVSPSLSPALCMGSPQLVLPSLLPAAAFRLTNKFTWGSNTEKKTTEFS